MAGRVGIIWDSPALLMRLVEDCGYNVEQVTPHLLAAPFFRREYMGVIIPGGFANPAYSSVLPALRACGDRLRRFINGGGTVLVFGAGIDRGDAYDWLSIPVRYRYGFDTGIAEGDTSHYPGCIAEECPGTVTIDGTLQIDLLVKGQRDHDTDDESGLQTGTNRGAVVHLRVNGEPILITYSYGRGRILVTTLHEYPSRRFLADFCVIEGETLL
ncbi:MAG TPA: hypothetical protein VN372_12730 [Methanospirillum sp.]|nr:hypothetical protein [Methanospirillum sp.]